ncbi:hypothetical protein NQZ68_024306 [Dissostichus eleginoides]|nr:hypothetical protein NQZ68_024306 [Dissostichus eleginoides]
MENNKKRKGGAEKARMKKRKLLQEEAGTFSKITELFSRRAPAPSRSNEEENEKEDDEPQTRHIMTAVDPEERETAAGSSTGEPKDREM